MLTRRVIPCLDVDGGRVVKGVRFAGLRDAGDPASLAGAYEAQGADEIVLLDVSAAVQNRATRMRTVREVRAALSIPLTVGGGVRRADDAAALLEAGADRVAVNSAAMRRPHLIDELAARFGCQCVVVAIDAAARVVANGSPGWDVVVNSGRERTGVDAVDWAAESAARGAGEILLTSWDRDGTRSGYELDLIRAVSGAVPVSVIASGGAASPAHLLEALWAGAEAVLAASILHDGRCTVTELKSYLDQHEVEMRP